MEVSVTEIDSEDLSAYVRSVVEGVKKGIPQGSDLQGAIKFEITIAKVKGAAGGFKVIVAEAGAKYGEEEVSKISFEVGKPPTYPGARWEDEQVTPKG
jgi:hypothetical protein